MKPNILRDLFSRILVKSVISTKFDPIYSMQQRILLVQLNSIFLLLKKFMKGDTADLLDIVLIKYALSPSSAFIDDFDVSF